jgi:hypothetical protein
VKLTLLGVESDDNGCPTLYRTDKGTFIVQGWRVTDVDALADMDIPAHETCVEIPPGLVKYFRSGKDAIS